MPDDTDGVTQIFQPDGPAVTYRLLVGSNCNCDLDAPETAT
ncbi:hypothetical protein Poly59_52470 [Rubripirellula reticaptiva]|uniref:Uncharacterized protein n=1 Tax=Rubripirellula reticaptiva TaxID=2528013 RepID=A0A5C6EM79_9BACT|nr:hypothetical protein Poly59_52470 [Rubripirellula reticaptiva]